MIIHNKSNLKQPKRISKSPESSYINNKKQSSLIEYLFKQYCKKYNLMGKNEMIRNEIIKYAEKINSSADLLTLDKIIEILIKNKKHQSLDNISKNNTIVSLDNQKKQFNSVDLNQGRCGERQVETRHSKMSGASDLSHYAAEKGRLKDKNDKMNLIDNLLNNKVKTKEEILDIHGNEWGLVAQYNKMLADQEKISITNQKRENKMKIKTELEKQMNYKKRMNHIEAEENQNYDCLLMKKINDLKFQEKDKNIERIRRSHELKNVRDTLLEEGKKRKANDKSKEIEKEIEISKT